MHLRGMVEDGLMLSLDDMQRELDRVTYFPGYSFELISHAYRGPVLKVHADVWNSRDWSQRIHVSPPHNIPRFAMLSTVAFHMWMQDILVQMAIHESIEGYQIDGEPRIDPHAHGWAERIEP